MIIRLEDIPLEGRKLSFPLDPATINGRLSGDGRLGEPTFVCGGSPVAQLELQANGKTVMITGTATADFVGNCSRCVEETKLTLDREIVMVLKPHAATPIEEIEDLQLGYYDGKEIDLTPIVEEQLILSLPYAFICSNDCKGLCPRCGANLNAGMCSCVPEGPKGGKEGEGGFKALRGLKLN